MIGRHTFKELITAVTTLDSGIVKLEDALGAHLDGNNFTKAQELVIHAIAEGFQETANINYDQVDIVEELLYHFIFMEDCGNDSEHCKSKLVIVNEGKEDAHSVPCTNVDELYNVITLFIERLDLDFTFNYCHSHKLDDET
jgi:hypothetical protein